MTNLLRDGATVLEMESGKSYIVFLNRDSVTPEDIKSLLQCKFNCELIVALIGVPAGSAVSDCVAATSARLVLAERERCALIADKESRECGDCYYCQVNHAKTVARLIRQEHDRGPQATAEDAVMDDGDGN